MKDSFIRSAVLRHVVDGDTVDLAVDLGFRAWVHLRFRLEGIDTPEMKGPTKPMGVLARQHLYLQLAHKTLTIESMGEFGKYGGTWMGVIIANGYNVNLKMLHDGYAVAYGGNGARRAWDPNAEYPLVGRLM